MQEYLVSKTSLGRIRISKIGWKLYVGKNVLEGRIGMKR